MIYLDKVGYKPVADNVVAMMLAGMRIPDHDVRELARIVDEPTRGVLERALERGTTIVALTVPDREMILRALDDPQTTPLAELRATLLLEHEWRQREGLV